MFCVIFEVLPEPARMDTYLELAARLKPEVERVDGFGSVERFTSRNRAGWVLSFQFWRDDAAIGEWRNHPLHRPMQERGRAELFLDYRLRIGPVIEDAANQPARTVAVVETSADRIAAAPLLADPDVFDSIYNPGRAVLLGTCPAGSPLAWRDRATAALGPDSRVSIVSVARDYTKADRAEAPEQDR